MIIYIFVVLVLLVLWFRFKRSIWEQRGIPGPKPWPIIGNIGSHFLGKKTLGEAYQEIYRKYDKYPFVGIYRGSTPCLMIRDPEFVQRILIKDFKYFQNNELYIDKNVDTLFAKNPFLLRGKEWKDTRQMLTPGFTSGRMKNLFPMVTTIAKTMINFIENDPTATTDGIETRLLTKRFTLDNVAKAAFGIDGKCFDRHDKLSEFMDIADSFLAPGSMQAFLTQLGQIFPILVRLFPKSFSTADIENKIVGFVSDVKKHRLENDVVANDYLQFLIELGKEHNFNDKDVTAHASTFFFDGYFTSSLVLSYLLLCLALHSEYQEKIRKEIKETEKRNNGEITYDSLHELIWLNASLYESTRIHPFIGSMMRLCNEEYEYTPQDSSFEKLTIKVQPEDVILIPYGILSKDPKYFPEPEKFMPERMLEKDAILNKVFFPFSCGPRSCIGQRMGIMQIKLGAAYIVKNFELSISPKMHLPVKYHPFNFINEVKGGIWLRYKKINTS